MSAYLYPNLKSKKAYKDAIKLGQVITAKENTLMGPVTIVTATVTFARFNHTGTCNGCCGK